MAPREDLRDALKNIVGPFLRSEGFRGSAPVWRLKTDQGDFAIVDVQRSKWSTLDQVECTINLAVVPGPWWDWQRHWRKGISVVEGSDRPSEGHGLYRSRLHPTGAAGGADTWWRIRNASDASSAADDMVDQLGANGLPALRLMLDRDSMVAALRQRDIGPMSDRGLAVMLSDLGPTEELEQLLRKIDALANTPHGGWTVELTAWVRHRAEARATQASPTKLE